MIIGKVVIDDCCFRLKQHKRIKKGGASLFSYTLKRLGQTVLVLIGITLITFLLLNVVPGDPVAMMLDKSFAGTSMPLISAAAVIAIAIISSNSILYSSKNQIKGLTTSVALWMCGIIGLTIGAGLYTVSVIGYAALMCCLALFPTFEIDLKNRSNHFEVHLELKNREDLQRFITTMRTLGLKIDDIEANPAYINSGLSVYSVSLTVRQKDRTKYSSHKEMIEAINTLDFVYYAEEID